MDYRIAGAMLNSALYLIGVFALGMATNNGWAVKGAVAAAGVTYLGYVAQAMGKQLIGNIIVAASIILGLAAGITLI